jgi:ElaB/YqjD/DUF883 family membrane-anchored ribosome-binding protein
MKNNRTNTRTSAELLDDLRLLVADTKTLVANSVADHSEDALAALGERYEAAQQRFGELYEGAREKVIAGAKSTDANIREHPYKAVAIALGVGVLIGAVFARRGR